MSRSARVLALMAVLGLMLVFSSFAQSEKPGSITGVAVDAKTGEALLGVNIYVEGTSMGAQCDLDGVYTVRNVPPGTYTLRASSVDYNTYTVNEVVVKAGEVTKINFTLTTKILELDNQITVTAKAVKNTEAILFKERQGSASVQDAISSEIIGKSDAGNAADAAEKITGASIVGGKSVYIRGLGDRYGNTQLNGAALPSTDASRGGSVAMDLIPSNILDNIVVTKSFTPDKSGDFAGGSVNLTTKDFPDKRTLVFSTSASFNSITTGKDVLTSGTTNPKAWLADDDGFYDYPSLIDDNPGLWSSTSAQRFSYITVPNSRLGDTMLVQTRTNVSKGFSSEFQPTTRKAPWNQSHSLSFGDNWQLFDRPLGVTANYNYSRKFSNRTGYRALYENGTVGNAYDLTYDFDHERTQDIYQLGGMLGVNYAVTNEHKVGWRYVYNRDGTTTSLQNIGPYLDYVPDALAVREFHQFYTERHLHSNQFDGKHSLLKDHLRFEWRYQTAETLEDQPGARQFADEVHADGDSLYYLFTSQITSAVPKYLYQTLDGSNRTLNLDFEVPFAAQAKLKFGSAVTREDRSKRLTTFEYSRGFQQAYNSSIYIGDPNAFFANELGTYDTVVSSTGTRYYYKTWISESTQDRDSYEGNSAVDAFYGMLEFPMPFINNLRVIGGLRYEEADMHVRQGGAGSDSVYAISESDRLPSLNFVYGLSQNVNLRLSYGKTLARPTIRELSPGADRISEEGGFGVQRLGNPELKITRIDNYDLRWEWFRRPGEVFAATLFYKRFENPIEIAIIGVHGATQPINAPDARVMGFELEMRSRMDIVWHRLSEVTVGGNFTMSDAWMTLGEFELSDIRDAWPNASDRRDMYGQSPYILNLDASWDHFNTGTSVSLFYNAFGERLVFNSNGINADVYEMPRHQLDFTLSQRILGPKLKLAVKNILDQDIVYKYLDRLPPEGERRGDQETGRYQRGVTVSLGMSYDIW